MTRTTRWITLALAALLVAAPALAAGSKPKKPKADGPAGVAEYNDGVSLMKKQRFAEAQEKFEAALEQNEKLAEAHNNLAYSLRKQGEARFGEALAHYDRAIELDPKLAEAYMYRGVLHALMGDEAKALADHAALVKLDRSLAESLKAAIASGEEPDGLEGLATAW